jgi:peptidyl-prolyl cis-trans isomerase-like protein 2
LLRARCFWRCDRLFTGFSAVGRSRSRTSNQSFVTQAERVANGFGGKTVESLTSQRSAFKRLPFDCCSLSLTPFSDPVCNRAGIVFDIVNLMAYLRKYKRDPISGAPASAADFTALRFHKDADGRFVCPVTQKQFTDHSTIVALRPTGHVYAREAIDELCLKAKNMHDLITDEPFTRDDIITIQDPHDTETRALANFHHLQHGHVAADAAADAAAANAANPTRNINLDATTARVIGRMQEQRLMSNSAATAATSDANDQQQEQQLLRAQAPSFTSSAFVARDMVADDPLLRIIKTKAKGYATLVTNFGNLNVELHCDLVSKTCENFFLLAERGEYDNTRFHRLIKNFMVQGGQPRDGSPGQSAFGKPLRDEFHPSLTHSGIGVLAMANAGANTGTRQFYVTFKSAPSLDGKHTVFGRVVGGLDVLRKLEQLPTNAVTDAPTVDVLLKQVIVVANPLSDEAQAAAKAKERDAAEAKRAAELLVYDSSNRGQWYSNPVPQLAGRESTEVGKYLETSAAASSSLSSSSSKKRSAAAAAATAGAEATLKADKRRNVKTELSDFSNW